MAKIFAGNSKVERVHGMICRGTLRENLTLILGQESLLPVGSSQYALLLKALFFAPPELEEVRRVVLRQTARYVSPGELIGLVENLNYIGSSNRREILELADLTLALNGDSMTSDEVDRLWKAMMRAAPGAK